MNKKLIFRILLCISVIGYALLCIFIFAFLLFNGVKPFAELIEGLPSIKLYLIDSYSGATMLFTLSLYIAFGLSLVLFFFYRKQLTKAVLHLITVPVIALWLFAMEYLPSGLNKMVYCFIMAIVVLSFVYSIKSAIVKYRSLKPESEI